jgi:hypothetical protein
VIIVDRAIVTHQLYGAFPELIRRTRKRDCALAEHGPLQVEHVWGCVPFTTL